jgi:hypothetical protein
MRGALAIVSFALASCGSPAPESSPAPAAADREPVLAREPGLLARPFAMTVPVLPGRPATRAKLIVWVGRDAMMIGTRVDGSDAEAVDPGAHPAPSATTLPGLLAAAISRRAGMGRGVLLVIDAEVPAERFLRVQHTMREAAGTPVVIDYAVADEDGLHALSLAASPRPLPPPNRAHPEEHLRADAWLLWTRAGVQLRARPRLRGEQAPLDRLGTIEREGAALDIGAGTCELPTPGDTARARIAEVLPALAPIEGEPVSLVLVPAPDTTFGALVGYIPARLPEHASVRLDDLPALSASASATMPSACGETVAPARVLAHLAAASSDRDPAYVIRGDNGVRARSLDLTLGPFGRWPSDPEHPDARIVRAGLAGWGGCSPPPVATTRPWSGDVRLVLQLAEDGTLRDAQFEGAAPETAADDLLACIRETMTDDGRLFAPGAHQRLEIDFAIDVTPVRP